MKPPNLNPSNKELFFFSLILLIPAALLFYFQFTITAYAIAIISVIGMLVPKFAKLNHNALMLLTYPIGFSLSFLIYALIYFLLITPLALIRKRPIDLSFPPKEKSNFNALPEKPASSYYEPF